MDALFGNDGTQPLSPLHLYPDSLSGLAGSTRMPVTTLRARTPLPGPVKPSRPSERVRRAVANHPAPAPARRSSRVPAAYSAAAPTAHVPQATLAQPKRNRGSAVLGCLVALLLIIGSLGFPVLQGILERLGILGH